MAKILVVEDDPGIAFTVRECLAHEQHTVEVVEDGEEALGRLRFYQYDAVILDWNLPKMSGLEVCQKFRSLGGTFPVLMLTARSEMESKISGLDAGADDYLTKPFNIMELLARVRALLRRPEPFQNNVLKAGDLVLDTASQRLTKDGVEVDLLAREYALLSFFMRHQDEVLTSEALLNRVWSSESDATSDALRSTLKRLRKKIDSAGQASMIETLRGSGYRFTTKPSSDSNEEED